MILPYTATPGNVIRAWVLIILSTDQYISGHGGCCRQAPGLGCTETKLLLMVL